MECWIVLCLVFFFNDTATTEIYTLSLHDALPISLLFFQNCMPGFAGSPKPAADVVRSEEHTSELQSRGLISYAVFCLQKNIDANHKHGVLHPPRVTPPFPPPHRR